MPKTYKIELPPNTPIVCNYCNSEVPANKSVAVPAPQIHEGKIVNVHVTICPACVGKQRPYNTSIANSTEAIINSTNKGIIDIANVGCEKLISLMKKEKADNITNKKWLTDPETGIMIFGLSLQNEIIGFRVFKFWRELNGVALYHVGCYDIAISHINIDSVDLSSLPCLELKQHKEQWVTDMEMRSRYSIPEISEDDKTLLIKMEVMLKTLCNRK